MKKLIILFISLLAVSCTSITDKVINSISSEIGKPTSEKTFKDNTKTITWENVSRLKNKTIKKIVDSSLNAIPKKTVELEPSLDQNGNLLPGESNQYWVYETPKTDIELDLDFKADKMTVKLHISEK